MFMQNNLLPQNIINHIDQIQRNFLWGTTTEKQRLYLVKWNQVSLPKQQGGLGIQKTIGKNMVLLAGLAWRFRQTLYTLWA